MGYRRGVVGILAVAAVVCGLGAVVAGPADAATGSAAAAVSPHDLETFENQSSHYCMYDNGNGYVFTKGCGGPNQTWSVTVWNDGTRQIQNTATNRCLGAGVGDAYTASPCDASTSQSWYIEFWNDGTISFQNQETGLCLADIKQRVTTQDCDSSAKNQSWF